MTVIDKTKPDVLRVTEFILAKAKIRETFSVCSAAKTEELNGIRDHHIAQIMRDICLDPEEPGSLIRYTTINGDNIHNVFCNWELNATSYFSYLSYLGIKESEKTNKLSIKTLIVAIFAAMIALIALFA